MLEAFALNLEERLRLGDVCFKRLEDRDELLGEPRLF
jgi:hypothetical protein